MKDKMLREFVGFSDMDDCTMLGRAKSTHKGYCKETSRLVYELYYRLELLEKFLGVTYMETPSVDGYPTYVKTKKEKQC